MNDSHNEAQTNRKVIRKKNKKLPLYKKILLTLITLGLVGVVIVTAFILGSLKDMPEIDEGKLRNYAITSEVYDNQNNLIAALHGEENRSPITLDQISPNMINAILSVEDQRFYDHMGIDLYRIAGAAVANIRDGFGSQGGSTLTQQLVKISFLDPKEKSLQRKVKEAFISIKLERTYSKDEILEMYLNKIYFGKGAYGVQAAAKTFFNVDAKDLTVKQSAMLAGVVQNPWMHSPTAHPQAAAKRLKTVLALMAENGKITAQDKESLYKDIDENGIGLDTSFITEEKSGKYQSFVDHVFEETLEKLDLENSNSSSVYSGGYKIYTTLDSKIQSKMEEVYADDTNFPVGKKDKIVQSAMVVLDPKTGEIKGLVGGRKQDGVRQFNRATQAHRQPGSIFKPIAVYGPALEKGFNPGSVFDDYPGSYVNGDSADLKVFKNYNDKYKGLITMRTAVKYSINTVAVKVLEQIGVDSGFMFAQDLGITSLVGSGAKNDKGLSLALGGLTYGVTPLEMASAYGGFANQGVHVEPYSISRIEDSDGNVIFEHQVKQNVVMSSQTAYLMTSMLESVVTSGTAPKARLADRPVAGKTGTTSFNVDAWFAGYTPDLVGVVWLGYDKKEKMHHVFGGSYGAPIWKKVMVAAHEDLPKSTFKKPSGITSLAIDTKSGLRPSSLTPPEFIQTELFNADNVPEGISDAWVQTELCPITGMAITPNCPKPGNLKVVLHRQNSWKDTDLPFVPQDADLEAPELCPLHGGGGSYAVSKFFPLRGEEIFHKNSTIIESIKLSWDFDTDSQNIEYDVHRSDKSSFVPTPTTRIGKTLDKTFIDKNVRQGEQYYYKIIAFDRKAMVQEALSITLPMPELEANEIETKEPATDSSEEVDSEEANAQKEINSIATSDEKAPNLTILPKKEGDDYMLYLKWSSPTKTGSYNYYIFRGSTANFVPGVDNQIAVDKTITKNRYLDDEIEKGKTYFYKVVAHNKDTNRKTAPSNEIRVGIPAE